MGDPFVFLAFLAILLGPMALAARMDFSKTFDDGWPEAAADELFDHVKTLPRYGFQSAPTASRAVARVVKDEAGLQAARDGAKQTTTWA